MTLFCILAIAVSWAAFGTGVAISAATGCEPNEGFAGSCMFLGLNWLPIFSGVGMIVGVTAFIASPFLLLVAIGCGSACLLRREW